MTADEFYKELSKLLPKIRQKGGGKWTYSDDERHVVSCYTNGRFDVFRDGELVELFEYEETLAWLTAIKRISPSHQDTLIPGQLVSIDPVSGKFIPCTVQDIPVGMALDSSTVSMNGMVVSISAFHHPPQDK